MCFLLGTLQKLMSQLHSFVLLHSVMRYWFSVGGHGAEVAAESSVCSGDNRLHPRLRGQELIELLGKLGRGKMAHDSIIRSLPNGDGQLSSLGQILHGRDKGSGSPHDHATNIPRHCGLVIVLGLLGFY